MLATQKITIHSRMPTQATDQWLGVLDESKNAAERAINLFRKELEMNQRIPDSLKDDIGKIFEEFTKDAEAAKRKAIDDLGKMIQGQYVVPCEVISLGNSIAGKGVLVFRPTGSMDSYST